MQVASSALTLLWSTWLLSWQPVCETGFSTSVIPSDWICCKNLWYALLSMIGNLQWFSVMYCGILLGSSSPPNLSSTLLIGDGQEGWGGHPRPHSFLADSLASLLKSSWHAPLFESFIVTEPLGPYASRWIQVWLRMTPSPDAWDQRGPGSLDDRIK